MRAKSLDFTTISPIFYIHCYAFALLSQSLFVRLRVAVCWFGSSFAFFCMAFALIKNINVLPDALAYFFQS
jgi:hypothetical protein